MKRESEKYIQKERKYISARSSLDMKGRRLQKNTQIERKTTHRNTHTPKIYGKNTHEYQPRLYVKRIRSFERTKGKNNNSEKKYVQMTETRPSLPLLYR